jgi:signal transduction histidine kinase
MAIVRRIVEAHGGEIFVGDASRGAEIVIRLPLYFDCLTSIDATQVILY